MRERGANKVVKCPQEPIRCSLQVPHKPLESTVSRVDLQIGRFPEEVSRADRGTSQWK